jgi:hypothetical protein
MCIREGFIKVMDWWKSVELIELIKEAAYRGQWRMLDILYNTEYQQACSDLKQFLNECIVNSAASAGQIDALEWAQDQGIHGGAELCMIAAWEGCLQVLQWLREDGATWDSRVISCPEEGGYEIHVFIFICIAFVDLFTDATHKSIVSFPYKSNTVLKSLLWKGQKTVGHLLLFRAQSFVAYKWGSHSFCPDTSSFCYCQEVTLLCLWPNKASECGICHHVRRQLHLSLKVPGVSPFLITYLLHNLYTII